MNPNPINSSVAPGGEPPSGAMQQLLRLAAGKEKYAVGIAAVREILEVSHMTPVPLMPGFVRGVINLRGAVVPVVDLSARLGFEGTVVGRRTCVVIVDVVSPTEGTEQTLGMLVDAVFEVFDTSAAALEAVPRLGMTIDPSFVRSIARVRGEATPVLDVSTVLDQDTLIRLIATHHPTH